MIIPLGRWVIMYAIESLTNIQQQTRDDLYITINISSYQLADLSIAEYFIEQLTHFNLSPSQVVLEVTETTLLSEDENTAMLLNRFRELGMKIALDDFGTGYSSISHLLNYQVDIVKLDRTLINAAENNEKHSYIMEAISQMLLKMGITTIAEGVENSNQQLMCKKYHIDLIQGYYYSKPLPANSLVEFYHAFSSGK